MKHMIWSNDYDAIKAIANDLLALEELEEEEAWERANDLNDEYLGDERVNLNIDVGYPIIVFANLGLWNGRHSAYKMLGSQNLRDCLNVCEGEYVEWFVDDDGDLKIRDTHHDGTNVYVFRALRGGLSDVQLDNFFDKLDYEGITSAGVKRYTRRLGDYAAKVYGWKLKGGVHC